MTKKKISIIKMSGEKDVFDETRLRHSLEKAGADPTVIDKVTKEITSTIHEGSTTKEIYRKAFSLLRKSRRSTAARYKLKKALFELGPTGFPFEKFVGALLKHRGFEVRVGVVVKGNCVNHEIDVVAEKDEKHYIVECKFHGDRSNFCDVKIPLYIHSRFMDVEKGSNGTSGNGINFHQGWLVTNTRFTSDAVKYGNCVGLHLISWDYPAKGSLKDMIDQAGLHPITSLTSITQNEKQYLIDKGIILCKDLCENKKVLSDISKSKTRIENILEEASELCGMH